jgi:AcrR family transcriptional regulator
MRYLPKHKQEARARMIEAAGRGFRRCGYGGIGVDGLAKEAGVTSGAFYGHFKSKESAFEGALIAGLDDLRATIRALQAEHGPAWLGVFVDLYLGPKRKCDLDSSCALQSLTPDVQRAGSAIQTAFQERATEVVHAIAEGLVGDAAERTAKAWALISILTGAVTLARSVADAATGEDIAAAARSAAQAICS